MRGQSLIDLDATVLEAVAGIDGAVVTDLEGRLLTFGAILRIGPDALKAAAVEGGPHPRRTRPLRIMDRSSRSGGRAT